MSKEKENFYRSMAPYAMEQQKRYGIPASVTLAQCYIESRGSEGGLNKTAREGNNYFGVKETRNSQIKDGLYVEAKDDDVGLSKFRVYDSPEASFEDHSKVLMSSRYNDAHSLASTDYEGWVHTLSEKGYASNPDYEKNLLADIKYYHLDQYDLQAVKEANSGGIQIGYMRGVASSSAGAVMSGAYGMPLRESQEMVLTSDYGERHISYGSSDHKGIDLRAAKGTDVYGTEQGGVVVAKGFQNSSGGKAGGGNYVYVAYPRPDGSYTVTGYLHLDSAYVDVGYTVSSDTIIGKSGTTGGVSPHLDFRVFEVKGEAAAALRDQIAEDHIQMPPKESRNYVDPKSYLGEIAVKGGIDTTLVRKDTNEEVLASYKEGYMHSDGYRQYQRDLAMADPGKDRQSDVDQDNGQEFGRQEDQRLGKLQSFIEKYQNDPFGAMMAMMGGEDTGMGQGGLFDGMMSALGCLAMLIIKEDDSQQQERSENNRHAEDNHREPVEVPVEVRRPNAANDHLLSMEVEGRLSELQVSYDEAMPQEQQSQSVGRGLS